MVLPGNKLLIDTSFKSNQIKSTDFAAWRFSIYLQINQTVTNFIFYLQFDKRLKVEFDGTKVVNLPEEHCSCTPTSTTTQGPIPPPPPGKWKSFPIKCVKCFFDNLSDLYTHA